MNHAMRRFVPLILLIALLFTPFEGLAQGPETATKRNQSRSTTSQGKDTQDGPNNLDPDKWLEPFFFFYSELAEVELAYSSGPVQMSNGAWNLRTYIQEDDHTFITLIGNTPDSVERISVFFFSDSFEADEQERRGNMYFDLICSVLHATIPEIGREDYADTLSAVRSSYQQVLQDDSTDTIRKVIGGYPVSYVLGFDPVTFFGFSIEIVKNDRAGTMTMKRFLLDSPHLSFFYPQSWIGVGKGTQLSQAQWDTIYEQSMHSEETLNNLFNKNTYFFALAPRGPAQRHPFTIFLNKASFPKLDTAALSADDLDEKLYQGVLEHFQTVAGQNMVWMLKPYKLSIGGRPGVEYAYLFNNMVVYSATFASDHGLLTFLCTAHIKDWWDGLDDEVNTVFFQAMDAIESLKQ